LYFNFFSASFCTTFLSAGIATTISVHTFSFFVFNYYIWPISCNFCVLSLLNCILLFFVGDFSFGFFLCTYVCMF
jgi:hypothetical protein